MPNTIGKKWCNSKDSYNNMRKLAHNNNLFCQEATQISPIVLYIMNKAGYTKNYDKPGTWKQIRRTQSS